MGRGALTCVLAVLLLVAGASGQAGRFADWDRMLDPSYRFDPDERTLLGFSVAVPIDARSAFDDVEALLDAGDALGAARLLVAVMERHAAHALQVAEGSDRWDSRWVGAGEWALYQLLMRIAPDVRAGVLTPEQQARLENAAAWRDQRVLADLSRRWEGLPEGTRSLRQLARLQAEEGRDAALAVTLARLDDPSWSAALAPSSAAPEGPGWDPPARSVLSYTWGGAGQPSPTTFDLLMRLDGRRRHPFLGPSDAREAPFAPIDPVVDEGVLYVSDSISTWAQDVVTGRWLWHFAGPLERVDAEQPWSADFDIGTYANHDRKRAISPYQVARPELDGDLVLVTLQMTQAAHQLDRFDNYPINHPLPRRRLFAIDRASGELRWRQERPELGEESFVNQFDAHGPPMVAGDTVYVAGSVTQGAINAYIAAFDRHDGELQWATPLCSGQQELTMFNRPFQEHLVSPVLLHEGALYVSTNLGVIGCVDAWSGRLRWIAAYESMERRSSRMVRPMNARPIHWLNQRPFVVGETLVVAPLDGEWLQGLDVHTGRRRFELSTGSGRLLSTPLRHQAVPAGEDRFVVVSDSGLECFDELGRPHWSSPPFGPYVECSGGVEVVGDRLLVPADPQLLVHDLRDGQQVAAYTLPGTPRDRQLQRIVPAGPAMVVVDGAELAAVVDRDAVRRRALEQDDVLGRLMLAELSLLEGDHDEALAHFERVVTSDRPRLAARARSGRAEALLRQAELRDTPSAWEAVLVHTEGPSELEVHADRALGALARLGAERTLVRWLERLAAENPTLIVSLDAEGPQPVGLVHARRQLPLLEPAEQVDVLQGLIELAPEARWEGLTVAETARRRIAALIEVHGREVYARVEQRALAAADQLDPEGLARRFPNAALVASQRRARLEGWLEQGRAADVLAETEDLDLRVAAARQLGETTYAALIDGSLPAYRDWLPALPVDASGLVHVQLHESRSIRFRSVSGRPGPGHEGVAVGCVDGEGALFLMDTARGGLRWSGRALPGGRTSVSSSVDFHLHDDVLVVRGRNDLEGLDLEDGRPRWSVGLSGDVLEFVPLGGLVVTLQEDAEGEFHVEGRGVASGAVLFRIHLPEIDDARLRRAGNELVCLTMGQTDKRGRSEDKRLLVLDLARGAVGPSLVLSDGYSLLNVCHDPPVVVLSEREGLGARLLAVDARHATVLWEHEVGSGRPTYKQLVPTGHGRLVLRQPALLPGRDTRRMDWDTLVPFDALTGPLPVPADTPVLRVVDPASTLTPHLVLIDPDDLRRHALVSGADLRPRFEFETDQALSSATEILQAADGIVMVPDRDDDGVVAVQVVRGEAPERRYSVDLEVGRSRLSPQAQLVDGAVVLGFGGDLMVIRSGTR